MIIISRFFIKAKYKPYHNFRLEFKVLSMKNNPFNFTPPATARPVKPREDFGELEATELYCSECGYAVPINKFLLLVLPDGDRYEYRCKHCGAKVGDKIDRSGQFYGILKG
jgi:hypothetical protein